MTLASTAFFLFLCMSAGAIQCITGFGFGVILMAALPFFLPYAQAVAVSSMCGGTLAAMVTIRCHKSIRYRLMWPMLAGYAVASTASIRFSLGQSREFLMRLLGIVLILLSLYFIFLNDRLRIRPSPKNGVIAGIFGGIGGGLFAIGGPPAVVYMLSATSDKGEYRATTQAYFALGGLISFLARLQSGLIDSQVIRLWGLALAALAAGVYLGNLFFRRISPTVLRRSVYAMMAVSGMIMLF